MQRILTWLGVTLLVLSPLSKAHSSAWPDNAQPLLEAAQRIVTKSPEIASIWPGFWSATEPFILYDDAGATLLFTTGTPLPNYTANADGFYFYPERLPDTPDFAYFIDYVLPDEQLATGARYRDGFQATLDTLVHEAFHGYQRRTFENLHRHTFVDASKFESPIIQGLLHFQFDLAKHAHQSQTHELLIDYLKFRVALANHFGPEIAQLLASFEHLEGTAYYVGTQAVAENYGRDQLAQFLAGIQHPMQHTNHLRTSSYATGAFIVDALSQHADEYSEWRTAIQSGRTPLDVALEVFAIDDTSAMDALDDILARHAAADFVNQASTRAPTQAISYDDVSATHPYALTVRVPVQLTEGNTALPLRFGGGSEGFQNLSQNQVFLPNPETFQFEFDGIKTNVVGTPVLADLSKMHEQLFQFTLWTSAPLQGLPSADADHELNRTQSRPLTLELEQTIISVHQDWRLRADSEPQHWVLELLPAQ